MRSCWIRWAAIQGPGSGTCVCIEEGNLKHRCIGFACIEKKAIKGKGRDWRGLSINQGMPRIAGNHQLLASGLVCDAEATWEMPWQAATARVVSGSQSHSLSQPGAPCQAASMCSPAGELWTAPASEAPWGPQYSVSCLGRGLKGGRTCLGLPDGSRKGYLYLLGCKVLLSSLSAVLLGSNTFLNRQVQYRTRRSGGIST